MLGRGLDLGRVGGEPINVFGWWRRQPAFSERRDCGCMPASVKAYPCGVRPERDCENQNRRCVHEIGDQKHGHGRARKRSNRAKKALDCVAPDRGCDAT